MNDPALNWIISLVSLVLGWMFIVVVYIVFTWWWLCCMTFLWCVTWQFTECVWTLDERCMRVCFVFRSQWGMWYFGATALAYFRRKKSVENQQQGPQEAKEERGSQILWRIWLERRQGRKRNRQKSEHDEDNGPNQACGTSLERGLSLNQAKGDQHNGTSQTRNSASSQSEGCVRRRSMHSSAEDSLPSDDDDVFERLSVPKLARYPQYKACIVPVYVLVATTNPHSNKHTEIGTWTHRLHVHT